MKNRQCNYSLEGELSIPILRGKIEYFTDDPVNVPSSRKLSEKEQKSGTSDLAVQGAKDDRP